MDFLAVLLVEVPGDWPWDVVGMVGHVEEKFPFCGYSAGDDVWSCVGLEVGLSCDLSVGFEEDGKDFATLVSSL